MILEQAALDKLGQKITDIEANSDVEILLGVRSASSTYLSLKLKSAFAFLLIFSIVYYFFPYIQGWHFESLFFMQGLGAFLGFVLGYSKLFKKIFLNKTYVQYKVRQKAQVDILEKGILNTKNKTGFFIYLSELEKQFYIFADQGLVESFGSKFVEEQRSFLTEELKQKDPYQALSLLLDNIKPLFENSFPQSSELENQVEKQVYKN